MKSKRATSYKLISVIIIIVAVILTINYVKNNGKVSEETARCIAEKSKLYVSKTCSACAHQKEILGNSLELFDVVDCSVEKEACKVQEILRIPTWVINNEKYLGVHDFSKLKEITGC